MKRCGKTPISSTCPRFIKGQFSPFTVCTPSIYIHRQYQPIIGGWYESYVYSLVTSMTFYMLLVTLPRKYLLIWKSLEIQMISAVTLIIFEIHAVSQNSVLVHSLRPEPARNMIGFSYSWLLSHIHFTCTHSHYTLKNLFFITMYDFYSLSLITRFNTPLPSPISIRPPRLPSRNRKTPAELKRKNYLIPIYYLMVILVWLCIGNNEVDMIWS